MQLFNVQIRYYFLKLCRYYNSLVFDCHNVVNRMSLKSRSSTSLELLENQEIIYVIPKRCIKIPLDVILWEKSRAYHDYLEFVLDMNQTIRGKPNSTKYNLSENVISILNLLNKIRENIQNFKSYGRAQKFGSLAFEAWYDVMKVESLNILQNTLPSQYGRALLEIHVYLLHSFGTPTKTEFGIGNEISFIMFLCCLYKLGILVEEDKLATILDIFKGYMDITRKLHQAYKMKSADAHYFWRLDDYHFVPFIWGSSQLMGNHEIVPNSYIDKSVATRYANEYMFMDCVDHTNQVHKGYFCEYASHLWCMSYIRDWSKINRGLIQMYKEEILNRFYMIKDIVFGTIMSFKPYVKE